MSVVGEQIAEDVPREPTGSGGTRCLVEHVGERPRWLLGQLTEPEQELELPPLAVGHRFIRGGGGRIEWYRDRLGEHGFMVAANGHPRQCLRQTAQMGR